MNFVGALLLISACLAQNCGDTRKMDCKQGCPETNGIRWHHYDTSNNLCCSSFGSCGGNQKHCRFNCDSCDSSCPSGYVSKGGVSKNRANTQARYQDCCNKKCEASDCTGIWKPKTTLPACVGLTCPKNTSTCCVLKDGHVEEGYSYELVKQGTCQQFGYEYITSRSTCETAARVLGIDASPDDAAYVQSGERTSFPVSIGSAVSLGISSGQFTAMAWVRRTEDGSRDYTIFGTDETSTNQGLHLVVRNRKYYMGFYANDCGSSTGSTLNVYEHVAFVYEQRTMKIYVNGQLKQTCTNKNQFTGTGTVRIGQWAGHYRWSGAIRDAKIYKRALSASEISFQAPSYAQSGERTSFPVNIGSAPSLGITSEQFTAMAWVRRTGNGSHDYTIFGTDETSTNNGLHLVVRNHKYYMGFYANDCGSSTGNTLNVYEHVAFVYDHRTMKIYVNGKLVQTCHNKNQFTGHGSVRIGQWEGRYWWSGAIRDAKIYKTALSESEIKTAGNVATFQQRNCGVVGGKTVTYTDQTTGAGVGNRAGQDQNHRDALQWQICKARTTAKLQCGSHACAYYYRHIGGTAVSNLLKSEKYQLGKFDWQEQLAHGLKTREHWADNYGVYVEAWVTAPHTGRYKFMTRSDDASVLYASVLPYMKNGEMRKVVELTGCCRRVTGSVELHWQQGKSYFVKGYMKEGGGGDYFEIGYQNQNNAWNVIPSSHLISGGCASIEINNVVITSDSISKTDNYAVKEDVQKEVNTCATLNGFTGSIESGAKTTITTSWEFTTDDSWSNTFGFTASVGATVRTKVNAGIQLKAVNVGKEVETSVTATLGTSTEFTQSGSEKETNGETTADEVFTTTTIDLSVPKEVNVIKKVLVSATKYDFQARWSGEATCLNEDGKPVGPSQQVGGTYSSFTLTDINVKVIDEFCEGGRFCQPDIKKLTADLHLSDPADVLARNYYQSKITEACRQTNCSQLPVGCRDNQERTAMWVYSKWFIERCQLKDFDPSCTCDFPITADNGQEIATAGLAWVNVAVWNQCTYGLKGSLGYDDIPANHKMDQFDFGRRRTNDEETIIPLAYRLRA